jgi:nucleoid-associated protein YgaU
MLTRGRIVATEGRLRGLAVEFAYNPTEYSVKKSNNWTLQPAKAGNVPNWEFGGGGPRELQVELLFDTTLRAGGADAPPDRAVRTAANRLFAFMMIDRALVTGAANAAHGLPPRCRMEWGRDTMHHFDCYITDCTVKFLLFAPDGEPVRATAGLSLKEVRDPEHLAALSPPPGWSTAVRRHVFRAGERLDLVAFRFYGDPAIWPHLAAANGIADPTAIPPGTTLVLPPL